MHCDPSSMIGCQPSALTEEITCVVMLANQPLLQGHRTEFFAMKKWQMNPAAAMQVKKRKCMAVDHPATLPPDLLEVILKKVRDRSQHVQEDPSGSACMLY